MKTKTIKKHKNNKNKRTNKRTRSKENTLYNGYKKDLTVKINPNYQQKFSCFTGEYKNIQTDKYNYKKFYKTYESNQQIKTLTYLATNYDNKILVQLLDLALKRFSPALLPSVYKTLMSGMNDSEIYSELAKLYRSPLNKFLNLSPTVCNKNKIISEIIYSNDLNKHMPPKIVNYLDIGCGNGSFTSTFGKQLKLTKDHIFGVDFANFFEQGDWGRGKHSSQFTFKQLETDKAYPFEDNFFDVITMKMVLHHISNIDFTFNEINRILKKDGILIIIDHDSFNYVDYMIADIEHAFYIHVFDENPRLEEYSKISKSKNKNIESLDIVKYYDWLELDNLLMKYNFKYMYGQFLNDSIKFDVSATRVKYGIYKISK
jgi:ubiquinone/menaquinone biosynthesis C-methylase UbiE